jgi:hypothetical protein
MQLSLLFFSFGPSWTGATSISGNKMELKLLELLEELLSVTEDRRRTAFEKTEQKKLWQKISVKVADVRAAFDVLED